MLFGVSHQCISKVAIQALIFVQNYFKLSLFFPQNFHLRKVVDKRYLYNFTAQVYILFTLILNLDSNRSCVSYDHGLGLNRKWPGSSLYQLGKRADNYP